MYEVLLTVDEDESRAKAQVAALVELPLEADSVFVRALHVFTDNPEGASVQQLGPAKAVGQALSERGIDYQLDERSGDPSTEILQHADEHDVDLLCLAGRKRSPSGKLLFGSVTQDVILGTDRPVFVSSRQDD